MYLQTQPADGDVSSFVVLSVCHRRMRPNLIAMNN